MERKEITITIAGEVGSGKSHIAYLLKKFLRNEGLEVNFECKPDFDTEFDFDKKMGATIYNCIEAFKDTRKIILKELQLPRKVINESR
jgi:uridine kinase